MNGSADCRAITAAVLDVASQTQDDSGAPGIAPFRLGPVEWTRRRHSFHARNVGSGPLLLTYSGRLDPARDLTVHTRHRVLEGPERQEVTHDLTTFADGMLVVAPYPVADSAKSGVRGAITFAIKSLALASSLTLVGGARLGVYRVADGYEARFTFTGPRPRRIGLVVKDSRGRSAELSSELDVAAAAGSGVTIALPEGLVLDPSVAELSLTLAHDADVLAGLLRG